MSRRPRAFTVAGAVLVAGLWAMSARALAAAPDAGGDLARKVANPLASLISVPIQYNHDGSLGPLDAERTVVQIQPVVPVALGASGWRILSRTIVPIVSIDADHANRVSGLGDVTQSLFLSPVQPTSGGWTLGAGPIVQLPTGTDGALTTDRWSAGPTVVAVRQARAWTYGVLAYHMWSIAGRDGARDMGTTFLQPFVNYITATRTTFAVNLEATRDGVNRTWSVPVHVIVNQLARIGPQPVSVFAGARYWGGGSEADPVGWGARGGVTLLFPKRGAVQPSPVDGAAMR